MKLFLFFNKNTYNIYLKLIHKKKKFYYLILYLHIILIKNRPVCLIYINKAKHDFVLNCTVYFIVHI